MNVSAEDSVDESRPPMDAYNLGANMAENSFNLLSSKNFAPGTAEKPNSSFAQALNNL